METKPARDNNAIDEIAFIVHLTKDIESDVLQNFEAMEQFSEDLPIKERINSMRLAFEGNTASQSSMSQKFSGVKFSKKSENSENRYAFSLRVENNKIIVACSEYSSWSEVWPKSLSLISTVLKNIDIENNPVQEIVYQCLDRFVSAVGEGEYDIGSVFNVESKYLTKKAISDNTNTWHVHQGWFSQTVDENVKALNNLNIDSFGIDNNRVETLINHIINIKKANDIPVNSVQEMLDASDGYLNRAINQAHNGNKSVVKDILNTEMLQALGLE